MSEKRALVACISDPTTDPRPRRAVEMLVRLGYRVDTVGFPPSRDIGIASAFSLPQASGGLVIGFLRRLRTLAGLLAARVIPSESLLAFVIQTRFGTRSLVGALSRERYDLIVVEDVQLLPLAFAIRGTARIVFDAREYYPAQDAGDFWFDLQHSREQAALCRTYMPRCDAVVTVSPGIADAYLKNFGVRATVVRSVTLGRDLPVNPVEPALKIVHHGVANRNRRLHQLVEIAAQLGERFSLDLYLTGDRTHIAELESIAANVKNVRFNKPVPYEKICAMLNGYDIGIVFYGEDNFNQVHCLPNKFFEYVQARLAIAISPSPDMANLVLEWGCGVVAPTYEPRSLIAMLKDLSAVDVERMKNASDAAARELRWEVEGRTLERVFTEVMA